MSTSTERGRRGLVIVGVGIVAVIIVALVIWGVATGSADTSSTSPSTSSSSPAPETTTSQPTPPATGEPEDDAASTSPSPEAIEVGLDTSAEPATGISARVTAVEAVTGEGQPGEVSGPALRVSVSIDNSGAEDLSLAGTTVNLAYGDADSPASPVSGPGVVAFPASVAPGQSTTGVFVFTVPVEDRARISVTLDLSASTPMVVFVGVGPS